MTHDPSLTIPSVPSPLPLRLDLQPELSELRRVRSALEREAAPVLGPATHLLVLAVDEALSNIIRHARKSPPQPRAGDAPAASTESGAPAAPAASGALALAVEISVSPAGVEVILTDDGPPFDPRRSPAVDVSERVKARQRGGLGVGILRQVADQLGYSRVGTHSNRLRLFKHAPRPAASAATTAAPEARPGPPAQARHPGSGKLAKSAGKGSAGKGRT